MAVAGDTFFTVSQLADLAIGNQVTPVSQSTTNHATSGGTGITATNDQQMAFDDSNSTHNITNTVKLTKVQVLFNHN